MAEKQRRALELRKAGMGFQSIADALGYANHTGAYKAVKAALKATIQHPADELRKVESERLDALLKACWQVALQGNLLAVDRVLSIMARRAALLGLNAPTEVNVKHELAEYARQRAAALGLDEAEAVATAERILRVGA
jgi:orotate phosphoribosyltransferase-like protein